MDMDLEDLRNELVGHKIVGASYEPAVDYRHEGYDVIQLDNGVELQLTGYGDCCASASIDLSDLVLSDNVITSVTTGDPTRRWPTTLRGRVTIHSRRATQRNQ